MKSFLLLSAVAGCGKSTWSKMYAGRHRNVKIVSSDELRNEIAGGYQVFDHEEEVGKTFYERINEYAKEDCDELTVIADATNLRNFWRLKAANLVKGYDRKVLIVIKKPLDVILKQNKMRPKEKIVPEEVVKAMYDSFEEPSEEVIKAYDEYCVYYKTFDLKKFKATLKKK